MSVIQGKEQYKFSVQYIRLMTQFEHKLISQARKTKGYLLKKSNSTFSSWKRKYFIFMQQSLSIFNDETLQSLQKSILFQSICEVNTRQQFIIEIKLIKKVYYLKAQSAADQDLWIASVNILRENHCQLLKSMTKKSLSSSQSLQKRSHQHQSQSMQKKSMTSSMRSIQHVGNCMQKTKIQISTIKNIQKEKITYLLRQKQLSKLLILLGLEKLSLVTKQQKYLKRILFIQDKKNGIYFSLSSKSIYPIIDSDLVREDFIYPYQLNVLYFLPIDTYKYAIENKILSIKLQQVCKCSEILECSLQNSTTIRLVIDCLKPIDIEVKQLSQSHVGKLLQCVKKMAQVGRQYWNPKGKLMRNIDEFIMRYYQNQGNQLVFYKMVQSQFQCAIHHNNHKNNSIAINNSNNTNNNNNNNFNKNQQQHHNKTITESHLNKLQSLTLSLRTFSQACDIKSPPLQQIKQKYVRLFHKFVYNHLNLNWTFLYNNATQEELIMYSKKVYNYYVVVGQVYNDQRVKQGCRTLVKIVLGKFFKAVQGLVANFINVQEQACRILKKVQVNNNNSNHNTSSFQQQQSITQNNNNNNKPQTQAHIFFSTFCTNLMSLISTHFHTLTQLPKSDQLLRLAWTTMTKIIKHSLQKLSILTQSYKQRSSLISVTNSLRMMRNKRLIQLFQQLQKTVLLSTGTCKREKQQFLKQITNEIILVQTFCIKKLFVITFSRIDKQLLKHEIPNIDFSKICQIVIEQITKLQHILPDVHITMYQSAFQQVCYFFYICVIKYDNSIRSIQLTKDQCLLMINMKMLAIRDSFVNKVQQDKIHGLLKDLNLLKQFITCPIHGIKSITRQLKRVFGSNFTQLNLKNLITLRVMTLKERQHLFQQCRQEIKTGSSYNSNQQLQSFPTQRQSFLNNNNNNTVHNNSRRQRVSTLTQSLKSYTQHFDHLQSIPKKQRTILFGVDNSIYQGYIYRKKIIKNFNNTNYTRLFYRLKKGKLFQYDNQYCQDILNCYMLQKLRKCYPQQQRQQCFYLQFDKQTIKFKLPSMDDASNWIMKILQAMQEQRSLLQLNQLEFQQDGVLFQDLQKKITLQTKQTQQAQSQPKNQYGVKMKKKQSGNHSPDGKVSLLSPKKAINNNNNLSSTIGTNVISSNNNNRKGIASQTKLKSKQKNKQVQILSKNVSNKNKRSKQKRGCGAGCNFF